MTATISAAILPSITQDSDAMRYFIHLAYNGAAYYGWQTQPDQTTVQETLENRLSLLLHEPIAVTGCGRTDTGVHASCFYAHFDLAEVLNEPACQQLTEKLNSFLPVDIAIYRIFAVLDCAHARFDATERTYHYYVATTKDPFMYPYRLRFFQVLNMEKMNEAAAYLLQHDDFTSFSKVHTQVNNFICHILHARWEACEGGMVFTITANRFLRNMVRAIVGTLLDVGRGKMTPEEFQQIILQKNRCKAGTSVPPHALFLSDVRYTWDDILPKS